MLERKIYMMRYSYNTIFIVLGYLPLSSENIFLDFLIPSVNGSLAIPLVLPFFFQGKTQGGRMKLQLLMNINRIGLMPNRTTLKQRAKQVLQ